MSAFNSKNFLKDSLVSPVDRIIKDTSQRLSYKSSDDLGDFASRILFGGAKNSTKSASSLLGNAIVAGLAAEFFGNFNNETSRFTRDQILQNRESQVDIKSSDSIQKINEQDRQQNSLYFPSEDLGKYKISFGFRKYVRPAPGVRANNTIENTIFLPIPRNLTESHSMNYSTPNLGAMGAAADYAQQSIASGSINATGAGGAVARNLASGGLLAGLGKKIGATALLSVPNLGEIVSQAFGIAGNPAPSVLFNGINLREHTFSWLLAPETEEESTNLKAIINYFRYASLPVTPEDTTAFLEYPLMCQVKLHPWAQEYGDMENVKGLYTFKHCMVRNFSVEYAPDGSPAFFGVNSEPGYVRLTLHLIEIEYFTANQFGRKGINFEKELQEAAQTIYNETESVINDYNERGVSDNKPNIDSKPVQEAPNSEKTNTDINSDLKSYYQRYDNAVNQFNKEYVDTKRVSVNVNGWGNSNLLSSSDQEGFDYTNASNSIVPIDQNIVRVNDSKLSKTVVQDEITRINLLKQEITNRERSLKSRQ
jgi:hypothetical protein